MKHSPADQISVGGYTRPHIWIFGLAYVLSSVDARVYWQMQAPGEKASGEQLTSYQV